MDIGSSKIKVAFLNLLNRKSFDVLGVGESSYAGFANGAFLEPENLTLALGNAIKGAKNGETVKELYVSIPAEFLLVKTNQASVSFTNRKKVTKQDIFALMDEGNDLKFSKDYTLISCDAISYTLDKQRVVTCAENQKAQTLSGTFGYVYADNECIVKLNSCFLELGLISVDYVSGPLTELLCLLDENARKDVAMIIDCGYITTHVLVGKNNGLLSLNSFSVGGGHIMSDLAQVLKIDFDQAEELKRKAIIVADEPSDGGYEITINGNLYEAPADIVSSVIKARIELIAQAINKALEISKINYPKYMPVFLTGGGIALIKGAKEYLSKVLDRHIEIINATSPQYAKPQYSGLMSLCNFACEKEFESSRGFLAKIFAK